MKRSHCHLLQKVIGTAEWEQAEQGSWPSYSHRPAIAPQTLLIPSELCWAWRWKNGFRSFLQTANVPWETFQAIWVRETLIVLRSLFVYVYTHTHTLKTLGVIKGLNNFLSCSSHTTLLLRIAGFLSVQTGSTVYTHTVLVPFPTAVFRSCRQKNNSIGRSFTPKIGDNLLNFITDWKKSLASLIIS